MVETRDYKSILSAVQADSRYRAAMDWGDPRPGHPEGSIRAHTAELEANLERLKPKLTSDEIDKLRLLVHVHDSLKPAAMTGVRCSHAQSHATLARLFLAEFCDDGDLALIVQNHDVREPLKWLIEQARTYRPIRFELSDLDVIS